MAANNRPLGRSTCCYATLAECVDSARMLHANIADATDSVAFDIASGHWRWLLTLDNIPVATCVHAYERRVECVRALAQFIAACRLADPSPSEVRHLGIHAMHGYPLKYPAAADCISAVAD